MSRSFWNALAALAVVAALALASAYMIVTIVHSVVDALARLP